MLVLCGCSVSFPGSDSSSGAAVSVSRLAEKNRSFLPSYSVFFSTPYSSDGTPVGRLVVVSTRGAVSHADVAPLDSGSCEVTPSGELLLPTENTSYRLGKGVAHEWKRVGTQGTGVASGLGTDGTWISLFNTGVVGGSYRTDAYFWSGRAKSHVTLKAVPDAGGIGLDSGFVVTGVDGSAGLPTTAVLYRITAQGRPSVLARWAVSRHARGGEYNIISNLHYYKGHLYFLEKVTPITKQGSYGDKVDLRLGSVNVSTGGYESRLITKREYSIVDGDTGQPTTLAISASAGHITKGMFYVIDWRGDVRAIALASGSQRVVGRVPGKLVRADQAVVGWEGNRATVLGYDNDSAKASVSTVDLESGRTTTVLSVPGIQRLTSGGELVPEAVCHAPS